MFVGCQNNTVLIGSENLAILMTKQPGNEDIDSDPFPFQVLGILLEDSTPCSCQ
jgi:hypothetical protein